MNQQTAVLLLMVMNGCAGHEARPPRVPSPTTAQPAQRPPSSAPAEPVATQLTDSAPTLGRDSSGAGRPAFAQAASLRLGHYSSADGLHGFDFDRTGAAPRIRLDGSREIVERTARPAPLNQTDLSAPHRGVIIRLGPNGEVTYFTNPRGDSVSMRRDADAEPITK